MSDFSIYSRRTNGLEGVKECAVVSTTELAQLRLLRQQIKALITESHGVAGLHLNGDLAEWDWLIENKWLSALEETRQC